MYAYIYIFLVKDLSILGLVVLFSKLLKFIFLCLSIRSFTKIARKHRQYIHGQEIALF